MSTQDDIDARLPDNTTNEISPGDLRAAFRDITTSASSVVAKSNSTLFGFDREAMDLGGKQNGIVQYCHSAASGDVHQIGSDGDGTYSLLTGQTQFADGTALADRTLMVYHDIGETQFSYWYGGEIVEETGAKFIQLTVDFEGYIYLDSTGALSHSSTDTRQLIIRETLVSYMYLNGTSGELVWFADERHGIVMDGQTHLMTHQDAGFFVAKGRGFDFSGITNNNNNFTSMSGGACGDEDIKMVISSKTTLPKMFKEGASGEWRITDDDDQLGIFRSSKSCYNLNTSGTWSLAEINSDYVGNVAVATNNKLAPVVIVIGQTLYANRGAARDNAYAEFYRIDTDGLPAQEIQALASWILHNEDTGEIEIGADGEIYTVLKRNFAYGIFS